MKKLIWVMVFLLLVSFVIAQPPAQEVTSTSSTIFTIETPSNMYFEAGQDYKYHVHVFNGSGYPLTNTTTSCRIHIYNEFGSHIAKSDMEFDEPFDWDFEVNESVMSNLGEGSYIIFCNDSSRGGFRADRYEITLDGEDDSSRDTTAGIVILLFCLSVIFFMLLLPFKIEFSKHYLLNETLKRCIWLLAAWLTTFTSAIVATISAEANIPLTSDIFTFMWLISWASYLFMFFILFDFMLKTLNFLREGKFKKRMNE